MDLNFITTLYTGINIDFSRDCNEVSRDSTANFKTNSRFAA